VHNSERPTDVFKLLYPGSPTKVFDIAPGFVIADGRVRETKLFEPVRAGDIIAAYREEYTAEQTGPVRQDYDVAFLCDRLKQNIEVARSYLREFRHDYAFLLVIKGADRAIEMRKRGNDISATVVPRSAADGDAYDIVFTTAFSYLRRTFTTPYGHETLFVGSGCTIRYRERARVRDNLHRELMAVLKQMDRAPRSRFGDQPRLLYEIKQSIRHLLGRREADLYDLDAWTVYRSPAERPAAPAALEHQGASR
jgi:hypothetical protein